MMVDRSKTLHVTIRSFLVLIKKLKDCLQNWHDCCSLVVRLTFVDPCEFHSVQHPAENRLKKVEQYDG